jgi:hypothetical protein
VVRLCDDPFGLGAVWPSVAERFSLVP